MPGSKNVYVPVSGRSRRTSANDVALSRGRMSAASPAAIQKRSSLHDVASAAMERDRVHLYEQLDELETSPDIRPRSGQCSPADVTSWQRRGRTASLVSTSPSPMRGERDYKEDWCLPRKESFSPRSRSAAGSFSCQDNTREHPQLPPSPRASSARSMRHSSPSLRPVCAVRTLPDGNCHGAVTSTSSSERDRSPSPGLRQQPVASSPVPVHRRESSPRPHWNSNVCNAVYDEVAKSGPARVQDRDEVFHDNDMCPNPLYSSGSRFRIASGGDMVANPLYSSEFDSRTSSSTCKSPSLGSPFSYHSRSSSPGPGLASLSESLLEIKISCVDKSPDSPESQSQSSFHPPR